MRSKTHLRKRTVVAVTTAAIAFGLGTGFAEAASSSGHHKKTYKTATATVQSTQGGSFLQAAANYLGLTTDQLRTQLQSGKSLAEIATAQGKSVSGLEDAIIAAATSQLNAAVSAGKLTAAQASTILSNLKSNVADLVNRTGTPAGAPGAAGRGAFVSVVTDYLGISATDLQTQLQSGKSLAQIATEQGKSVSGLEDAIIAAAKTQLDAAVAAGKLTAAQEATILSNLRAHVGDIVNRSGSASGRPAGAPTGAGGPGFFGGPPVGVGP